MGAKNSKQLNEKAKSTNQQQLMGMVYAYKRGELKDPPEKVKKIAKGISMEDAKEYAETKHKGKPEHVKEIRNMSFMDYVDSTTLRSLNEEEWKPVDYLYVWNDKVGNRIFIRVTQKNEGDQVKVVAFGSDNTRRGLHDLMFMRPDFGKKQSEQEIMNAVNNLFFGDELMRPSPEEVHEALERVTKLDLQRAG